MRLGPRLATSVFLILLTQGLTGFSYQLTNISKGFNVGAGGALYVNLDQGDVSINTGMGSVTVEVYGIDQRELNYLNVRESGGNVYVEFDVDGRSYSDIKVEIGIPETFNVDIKTAGGDVLVDGDIRGLTTVRTAGGDIEMDNIFGEAEVRTAGGDIEAGIVEGDALFKTAGGDIDVASVNGQVEVATSGGDITVGNVDQELEATTAGGDIELGDVGGNAYAKTAGGDIDVGKVGGKAELKTAGGDILLAAANGHVEAKTAGGDLELRNVSGSINANTAGGDILAELNPNGGSGPSELETAGGDVRLYLPSNANVRIEAVIEIRGNWERRSQEYGIFSDFPEVQSQRDASSDEIRADAVLNGGGSLITLKTVNGDIYIKKMMN